MGKQEAMLAGRNDGMAYALKVVEERGVEGLREEIRYRGITGVSLPVSKRDLTRASQQMALHATEVAIAISVEALREGFHFSRSQLREFKNVFDGLVQECLEDTEKIVELETKAGLTGIE